MTFNPLLRKKVHRSIGIENKELLRLFSWEDKEMATVNNAEFGAQRNQVIPRRKGNSFSLQKRDKVLSMFILFSIVIGGIPGLYMVFSDFVNWLH